MAFKMCNSVIRDPQGRGKVKRLSGPGADHYHIGVWVEADDPAQMERVTPNGYDDNARTLLSTPLYSNTTIVSFLPTLVGGSTVHLMPKFNARGYLEIVQKERITHTMLVPVQYRRSMDVPDFDRFDLTSMRIKFSTSAPLRADVKSAVLKRFPGKLIEYYGLTEGGGVTVLVADEYVEKLHTVGRPAPGNAICLIGPDDREVAQGDVIRRDEQPFARALLVRKIENTLRVPFHACAAKGDAFDIEAETFG